MTVNHHILEALARERAAELHRAAAAPRVAATPRRRRWRHASDHPVTVRRALRGVTSAGSDPS